MPRVHHCGQLMDCTPTELKSGGTRYDLICGYCGHHEQEVYTATGKSVAWRNVSLQQQVARQKAALADSKVAA